jgi:hypothetical protein
MRSTAGSTDVHTGAQPDMLQRREGFNLIIRVFVFFGSHTIA